MKYIFPLILSLINFTAQAQISNIDFNKFSANSIGGNASSNAIFMCDIVYDHFEPSVSDYEIEKVLRTLTNGKVSKIKLEAVTIETIILDYVGNTLNVMGADGKKMASYKLLENASNQIEELTNKLIADAGTVSKINNQKQSMQNTYRNEAERIQQLSYELQFYQKARLDNADVTITINNPSYAESNNMVGQKLNKVVVTPTETILYFTYTAHTEKLTYGGTGYSTFLLFVSTTLITNNGEVLKLIRGDNLGTLCSTCWATSSRYEDPITSWKAIFPKIDPNTTTIDFESNTTRYGGYYIHGIQLK